MGRKLTGREEGVKEDMSGVGKGDGFEDVKSGDDLPEPQTLPPAYTSYGSPVTHGRREGEWSYTPEDEIIYSSSPSQGPDEGSGIQGHGFSRKGKEFVGMVDSAFLNGASDLHHRPKTPPPVLIAVMGKTGTGKTSFVNAVTGKGFTVGHDLEACTQDIQAASTNINGREVWLIDTPGFDDTHRSNVDILSTIANWVQQPNHEHKHLSGIIYLHGIIDTRMEGSNMRNLRMFRELCGEENFKNVILCTTMWRKVDQEEGRRREDQLKSKETFWGSLISRGAQVVRHQGDLTASARKIVESLIPKDTIVLKFQKELGQGDSLSDTSAGRVLTGGIEVMKKKHEEEMAALKAEMQANSDKQEEVKRLNEYYKKEVEGLKKVTDDLEKLRVGDARRFNKMRAGDARRFNNRLGDLQRKLDNSDYLEKLRAEDARLFNERLDDLQRKLDNSGGCIVC